MSNKEAWLALIHTPGVGPTLVHRLLKSAHCPNQILAAAMHGCPIEGLSPKLLSAVRAYSRENVEKDLAWENASPNHAIIGFDDPLYPQLLKQIPTDAPLALYVNGNPKLLNQPQIAIVGSRRASAAGLRATGEFAQPLAASGLVITSGLAVGIDAAAHRAALDVAGHTVAVSGTGLDRVYPHYHKKLADEIVEKQGAIISEFPIGTPPSRTNFPRRNRIISGITLGTLVVEATLQSGSLITARLANEQGREVFAVPGSVFNPAAKGCHALIKQGAKLAECADDIIEEIGAMACWPLSDSVRDLSRDREPDLSGKYSLVFNQLGYEPTPIDNLIDKTGLRAEEVSAILMELEVNGYVAAMTGGFYSRQAT